MPKFRLVDRILEQDDPECLGTVKAISLGEHGLLEIWGRDGTYPESLLVGLAVESAALLVARTSGFASYGHLDELRSIGFSSAVRTGAVLTCRVRRCRIESGRHHCAATIFGGNDPVMSGELVVRELPLESCYDPARFALFWSAIHGAAR